MGKRVLFSKEQIATRVKEIAATISEDHPQAHSEEGLLLIAILKGAARFANDIQSALYNTHGVDAPIEYVPISSYGNGTHSSGKPVIETNPELLEERVKGKHVVVIEDILDTGHTLRMFLDVLQEMGVSSIVTIVLLAKDIVRDPEVEVDHIGFHILDEWVEGNGIDTAQRGRGNDDIVQITSD